MSSAQENDYPFQKFRNYKFMLDEFAVIQEYENRFDVDLFRYSFRTTLNSPKNEFSDLCDQQSMAFIHKGKIK